MARPSEHDIAEVLLHALTGQELPARILVAGDTSGRIAATLRERRAALAQTIKPSAVALATTMPTTDRLTEWRRRGAEASSWPDGGPFDVAILRLPPAKDELEMALHALASVLVPPGQLWLYGANDEGVRSAADIVETVFDQVQTMSTRRHSRVIRAFRPADIEGLRPRLADWRGQREIELCGSRFAVATYPGVFASGRLDPATNLLIEHLPPIVPGARLLDYGCGVGIIGLALAAREPAAQLIQVDEDAVALAAAAENVPAADTQLVTAPGGIWMGQLDGIISNPPIHKGKIEDHDVLRQLVTDALSRLKLNGFLQIVVQRRVEIAPHINAVFGNCETVAETGTFRVFRAIRQRAALGRPAARGIGFKPKLVRRRDGR